MRSIFLVVLTLAALAACDPSKHENSNVPANNATRPEAAPSASKANNSPIALATPKPGIIATLAKSKGKYPYELKLLDEPELKARLQKLMGVDFAAMKANWNVETPIEIQNGILMTSGCQQHNCGGNIYYMFIDLERDNINVYHVENGKRSYFENGRIDLPRSFADEMSSED
jgi:hypothetical protein